jgi:hypothetical protein
MKEGMLVTTAPGTEYFGKFDSSVGIVTLIKEEMGGRSILVEWPDYAGLLHDGNHVMQIRMERNDYWWMYEDELVPCLPKELVSLEDML